MRSWPGGSRREAYRDDGVEWDATSIMLKAVELPHMLRGSVLLPCERQEMGPDCAPEEVMEEGDSRKWDIRRVMEWDITVNQPDTYVVGLVD